MLAAAKSYVATGYETTKGYVASGYETTKGAVVAGIETTKDIASELTSQTVLAAGTIVSAVKDARTAAPTTTTTVDESPAAGAAPQTPVRGGGSSKGAVAGVVAASEAGGNTSSPSVKETIASFEARSSPTKKPAAGMLKKQGSSFMRRLSDRISPSKSKEAAAAPAGVVTDAGLQEVVTSLSPPAPIRKTLASPVANGEVNPAPVSAAMVTPPTATGSAARAKTPVSAEAQGIKKTLSGRLLFRTPSRKLSDSNNGIGSRNATPTPISVPPSSSDKAPGSVNGSDSPTSAGSSPSSVDGTTGEKTLGRQGSLEKLKSTLKKADWR